MRRPHKNNRRSSGRKLSTTHRPRRMRKLKSSKLYFVGGYVA